MHSEKALQRAPAARDERTSDVPPAGSGSLPPLKISSDHRFSIPELERLIRDQQRRPTRILEAGCGRKWPLKLDGVSYHLTAVDVDRDALEARKTVTRDIDDVFVGDLRTSDLFAPASFDVIYNSFVLEHIEGAEGVLDNFRRWLAPGGLMILRIPDRDTVYGFMTRYTPHGLHVLYKRYIQGMKTAGLPGHGPYPTVYDAVVSRRAIHRYCRDHGCRVRYESGFSGYLPRKPWFRFPSAVLVRLISALSLQKLDWRYNNLTIVIEK
jgi:SAM-dependent methyltransferase